MPKINLLNKIKTRQIKKHQLQKNAVWIIRKDVNNQKYYVQEAHSKGQDYIVTWTNNRLKSIKFHTEKGCQHFVRSYLKNRSDIHLTWIEDNTQ